VDDAPSVRPCEPEHRGTLPPLPTRFFGREAEIARLRRLLLGEGVRLVTLTGPGGSGKTRLAHEAATRLQDALDGAVWFVPLADLSEPRLIIDTIHSALGLPRQPQRDPRVQVVEALSRRPSLLVLDNLEHLMPDAVPLVRELLEDAPLVQCLVTSRQILELTPEREIAVGPLPVPGVQAFRRSGIGEEADLNALAANESVGLFVDRAQRARPDFQLTRANAAAVAELCRRLEGIPLALELAAAWVKQIPPAKMLHQLGQRFDLLVSRQRDLPSRHQTLRAAIDWSYQLLSPELQRFFARLFVFRGGFTSEAAAAVCQSPDLAREYLVALRDSSLVQADDSGEETRFRLLETLWEYAAEQLSPAEQMEATRRHALYYTALAEMAEPELGAGVRQLQWLKRIEEEHENLRAVLDWAVLAGESLIGLRLAGAIRRFWALCGHAREGRARLEALVRLPSAPTHKSARAKALLAIGLLASTQNEPDEARPPLEESLALRRELGDRFGIAETLINLGNLAGPAEPRAAMALYEEALSLWRAIGHRPGIAGTLNNVGLIAESLGEYDTARASWAESGCIWRELGCAEGIVQSLQREADLLILQGNSIQARASYEDSLRLARQSGLTSAIGGILVSLASLALCENERGNARSFLDESLRICRDSGGKVGIIRCLETFAALAALEQNATQAASLLGAAQSLRDNIAAPRRPQEWAQYEKCVTTASACLGEEGFQSAWNAGRIMAPEQAIACALNGSSPPGSDPLTA
jgi:predicted ATPase